MGMKRKKKSGCVGSSTQGSGVYASVEYPVPDGKSTSHRPRRNNPWGNLVEEDTYQENGYNYDNYDYSDTDYEDDHDNYYLNSHYD